MCHVCYSRFRQESQWMNLVWNFQQALRRLLTPRLLPGNFPGVLPFHVLPNATTFSVTTVTFFPSVFVCVCSCPPPAPSAATHCPHAEGHLALEQTHEPSPGLGALFPLS